MHQLAIDILTIFAVISFVIFCVLIVVVLLVYIRDKLQTKQAILRNYPVIGHFRYFFEYLGHFFRQYFFAADREELPFNRADRSWVYRAAKNIDTTVAFGSTRSLTNTGAVIFVNCPFPTMRCDAVQPECITIGPYCKHPYSTKSLFNISAMSFGALSAPAVQALSHGAKKANCWLNTGEGGIAPYHLEGGCDLIAQIGTAKYGYRTLDGKLDHDKLREAAAYPQVKMFELKLSQGAKPGKGGILPAAKVTAQIAHIRGIPAGEDSISPNRHPEINDVAALLDLVAEVREVTQKPVGIKAVLGSGVLIADICEEINKRGKTSAPDYISIDSADGGTGAAPAALMDYMGMPIKESLPMTVDLLIKHGLRDRIKVIASGKLITPAQIAWSLCVGADFVVSARGFMFALGCIQAMQCNKNTCPTGVTTHDKRLQAGLVPVSKAERVSAYVHNMLHEVGQIAHSCGVREPRQLGRDHCRIVLDNGMSVPLTELYRVPQDENNNS